MISPGIEPLLQSIAAAARSAVEGVLHGAGCSCCGGSAIILTSAELVEDVAFALRSRSAAVPARLALLDASPPLAGDDLAAWLRRVSAADASGESVAILEEALAMVSSIGASAMRGLTERGSRT